MQGRTKMWEHRETKTDLEQTLGLTRGEKIGESKRKTRGHDTKTSGEKNDLTQRKKTFSDQPRGKSTKRGDKDQRGAGMGKKNGGELKLGSRPTRCSGWPGGWVSGFLSSKQKNHEERTKERDALLSLGNNTWSKKA